MTCTARFISSPKQSIICQIRSNKRCSRFWSIKYHVPRSSNCPIMYPAVLIIIVARGSKYGESDILDIPMRKQKLLTVAFGAMPASATPTLASEYGIIGLGDIGGPSYASAINNQGQIVGEALLPNGNEQAFLWQQATGIVDLGTLPGDQVSVALAINNSGVIAGYSQSAEGDAADTSPRPFAWQLSTGMKDLTAGNGWVGYADSINEQGQVVGIATTNPSLPSAFGFVYTPGTGITKAIVTGVSVTEIQRINSQGQWVVNSPNTDSLLFTSQAPHPSK